MRIADMRLLEGIERIPLGSEIERYVTDDSHARAAWQRPAVIDPSIHRVERPRPARILASRFSNPNLELDEQESGDVTITRPDGVRVHVYRHAIEVTIRKADEK